MKFKRMVEVYNTWKKKHPTAAEEITLEEIFEILTETKMENGMEAIKGMKNDTGKQKWHALPLVILEPLADVMEAGARKYEKFNCLQPFDNADERFWNSTMRHLVACQFDPLAIDPETGCYHAAQACFGMLMRIRNAKMGGNAAEKPEQMAFGWKKVDENMGRDSEVIAAAKKCPIIKS